MKTKYIIPGLISLTALFFSCVGEDVVFVEELNNSVSFERKLHSIAEDETFSLNLVFRDTDNNLINDLSNINIEYSSDDTSILSVNDQGVLTPQASGITTIRVNASSGDLIFNEIEDEIIIGKVTISEAEALQIDNDENIDLSEIVSEGYTPKITINNPISEIDIDSDEVFQFNATYQNIKNQIEEVVFGWESSDLNILEITENGTLTPISKGESIITASFNNGNKIVTSAPLLITVSEETVVVDDPDTPVDTGEIIGFGSFQSNSSYTVVGDFQIIRDNGITTLVLNENYSTGSVPDLVIYLSNQTNTNNGATFISEDITQSGEQSFIIPDTINPDDYINVLLFCRDFGARVGFGVINR